MPWKRNMENKKITIFDATLRDGSHAVKHQLDLSTIEAYCKGIDNSGVDAVFVGHGNGLGASSIQIGLSKHTDEEMLTTAKKALVHTPLGIYMIPGFGTIQDQLIPAIEWGADIFKVGAHCTEADVLKEHIEFLKNKDKDVYGVLMSTHMAENNRLLEEAKKIESYGADGIVFMDSAGALLPDKVQDLVRLVKQNTKLKIGYHGHNNLGMAVGNTLVALNAGAEIIDGTLMGFGAGAGNCQIEAIVAILQKMGMAKNINLYQIMDVAENIIEKKLKYTQGIKEVSIISGIAGVFSAFKEKVFEAAKIYDIDPRDIFMELGKRKVVGGQEDMIIDVAINLKQKKKEEAENYMVESLL